MGSHSIRQRWFLITLAFIVLRTFFALVWDVTFASAKNDCAPFADSVVNQWGSNALGQVACKPPDGNYATVGHKPNSYLILDMGEGNEINDQPGADLIYYSQLNENGSLAPVEISVASENGDNCSEDFVSVFVWTGGANDSKVEIDIAKSPNINLETSYRYICFRPWPSDVQPSEENLVKVDAVENAHPPYSPTPTPTEIPTVENTFTPVPEPTETPVPEITDTPPPTLTDTPTETQTLVITDIPTETQTSTHTPTITLTPTDTFTPSLTSTPTEAATSTHIPTATYTLTATFTLTATRIPTKTPRLNTAPSNTPDTSDDTLTPTITATPTLTPTMTFTATKTPIKARTPIKNFTVSATYVPTLKPTNMVMPTIATTYTLMTTSMPTQTLIPTNIPGTPQAPKEPDCFFCLDYIDCQGLVTNLISKGIELLIGTALTILLVILVKRFSWIENLVTLWLKFITIGSDKSAKETVDSDKPADKKAPTQNGNTSNTATTKAEGRFIIIAAVAAIIGAIILALFDPLKKKK